MSCHVASHVKRVRVLGKSVGSMRVKMIELQLLYLIMCINVVLEKIRNKKHKQLVVVVTVVTSNPITPS